MNYSDKQVFPYEYRVFHQDKIIVSGDEYQAISYDYIFYRVLEQDLDPEFKVNAQDLFKLSQREFSLEVDYYTAPNKEELAVGVALENLLIGAVYDKNNYSEFIIEL